MRLAQNRARIAYLSAFLGHMLMMRRGTGHEVGMKQAHLRTVQKSNKMRRLVVRMTAMQNVGDCFRTYAMTLEASLDALLHCFVF